MTSFTNMYIDKKHYRPAPGAFFRRILPEPAISFASQTGQKLFRSSLCANQANCYFSLADNYHTQSEPAFCGLGTLVMVLNALRIDPLRKWKGAWRWWTEELLDCCEPLEVVEEKGIALDKLACLGRCNGANVKVKRPQFHSVEDFREDVRVLTGPVSATSDDEESRLLATLVCSYSRKEIGQSGDGHFSPVGAYDPESDHVLMFDVARFKYPAHWLPLQKLYDAMSRDDESTGNARGWMIISPAEAPTTPYFLKLCLTDPKLSSSSSSTDSSSSITPDTTNSSNNVHNQPRLINQPQSSLGYGQWDGTWEALNNILSIELPNKIKEFVENQSQSGSHNLPLSSNAEYGDEKGGEGEEGGEEEEGGEKEKGKDGATIEQQQTEEAMVQQYCAKLFVHVLEHTAPFLKLSCKKWVETSCMCRLSYNCETETEDQPSTNAKTNLQPPSGYDRSSDKQSSNTKSNSDSKSKVAAAASDSASASVSRSNSHAAQSPGPNQGLEQKRVRHIKARTTEEIRSAAIGYQVRDILTLFAEQISSVDPVYELLSTLANQEYASGGSALEECAATVPLFKQDPCILQACLLRILPMEIWLPVKRYNPCAYQWIIENVTDLTRLPTPAATELASVQNQLLSMEEFNAHAATKAHSCAQL